MKQLFFFLFSLVVCNATGQQITSPDGKYVMAISGDMTYSVTYGGSTVVARGQMGVEIDNRLFESALGVPRGRHFDWCGDLTLTGQQTSSVDTLWHPVYGENASVRDNYNQLVLHYEKGSQQGAADGAYDKRKYYAMDIVVRAYNEGIAFRYHFPETANCLFLHITGEKTSYAMSEGTEVWYEEWAQGPFDVRPLKGEWYESERPLLMRLADGKYVALLEADLRDYTRSKFSLAADNTLSVSAYGCADVMSPYNTPWRVLMVGERAVDLINNKDIILNLCAPSRYEKDEVARREAAWIRPGKAFRSCSLAKADIMRSIDFCKAAGIDYVELDAGWYGPEGKMASDATKVLSTRDFTMEEVCRYARSQGVGVWVYVNQRALYQQLDQLLPLYKQWGISGVKFGFVQIGNQQWTTWLHDAVRRCGEAGLMVDIHDEYRPTGLSRTYPNLLTQEGVAGNEVMPDARHNVTLPFTRFLCGAADYTICYFADRIQTTRGHQLAMAAVYYSPLQFLYWYDRPFTKGWDSEELAFWRDIPTVFDESVALDGQPGEYIVQARRSGDTWYVGCMTNEKQRELTVSTEFLRANSAPAKHEQRAKHRWTVTIYNDSPSPSSAASVLTQTLTLKAGEPIKLHLQANGGAAIMIKPSKR